MHEARRDGRANDRLVCSPYYPQHDGWAARFKGRRVDNAVGWTLGRPPVAVCAAVRGAKQSGRTEAVVQAEHRLNLARQTKKMATRINRQFLATSNPIVHTRKSKADTHH